MCSTATTSRTRRSPLRPMRSRSSSNRWPPMPDSPDRSIYRALVRQALAEDVGPGDITTRAIVPPAARAEAVILAKAKGVIAGLDVAREVFAQVDPLITVEDV